MRGRFDQLDHILRKQGWTAAEERAHTRPFMQGDAPQVGTIASIQLRLERIERHRDLHA